jgi:hypothetical protein
VPVIFGGLECPEDKELGRLWVCLKTGANELRCGLGSREGWQANQSLSHGDQNDLCLCLGKVHSERTGFRLLTVNDERLTLDRARQDPKFDAQSWDGRNAYVRGDLPRRRTLRGGPYFAGPGTRTALWSTG